MSYLTESIGELEAEVVAGLAGEGFTFNRKTETRAEFYARALGDSTAYLRKPLAQLAAELNSEFGGSARSHLTESYAQLLDDLDTTLDEGGGGGDEYAADAVHFDGASSLRVASIVAATGRNLSFSAWFKIAPAVINFCVLWENDLAGVAPNYAQFVGNDPTGLKVQCSSEDGSTASISGTSPGDLETYDDAWHHVLYTCQTSEAVPSDNIRVMYYDDVKLALDLADSGSGAFDLVFSGKDFFVGDDGQGGNEFIGDMADFWFAPNVSLLSGNDIPEATRRLFISAGGKPVSPAGFPAGAAVLFSGDATTFRTNQGSGGAFTLIGSLTNASTSPSD